MIMEATVSDPLSAPAVVYLLIAALTGAGGVIAALARAIYLGAREAKAELRALLEAHAAEVKALHSERHAVDAAHAATTLASSREAIETLTVVSANLSAFAAKLDESAAKDEFERAPPTRGGKRGQ